MPLTMTRTSAALVLVIVRGISLHASGVASVGVMLPPEASYPHGSHRLNQSRKEEKLSIAAHSLRSIGFGRGSRTYKGNECRDDALLDVACLAPADRGVGCDRT